MSVVFDHMSSERDQSKRQILWAAVILIGVALVVSTVLLFGRKLPGLWGEWASTLIGVMTTPFLMEASFILIGISIVAVLNHLASSRLGDEWVDLEKFESIEREKKAMSDLSYGDFDETTLRSAVDVKRFARLAADDAAGFARMMREYLAETREIAASWPHILQLGKVDEVLMQLHTCKGGAAIFGFARMIAMITELEKKTNIASGAYDAQVFEKELVLVEHAIDAWVGGLLA